MAVIIPNTKEYRHLHEWIRKHYGNAHKCENSLCSKTSTTFEWALIKGMEYAYDITHFMQLCRSCHKKYDGSPFKGKHHSEETKKIIREKRAKQIMMPSKEHVNYLLNPKKCKYCNKPIPFIYRKKKKYCNRKCYENMKNKRNKICVQ